MTPEDYLKLLDGFAGFAALVNGILLWPVVKSLKADQTDLRKMVESLVTRLLGRKPKRKQLPKKTK